mmetsp:Transcript_69182/g.184371  ORF Transcript_69182/g.184371 Transcript_69182/m.184371 type:complete len:361 (-) Transcript_69182:137-1219(-)
MATQGPWARASFTTLRQTRYLRRRTMQRNTLLSDYCFYPSRTSPTITARADERCCSQTRRRRRRRRRPDQGLLPRERSLALTKMKSFFAASISCTKSSPKCLQRGCESLSGCLQPSYGSFASRKKGPITFATRKSHQCCAKFMLPLLRRMVKWLQLHLILFPLLSHEQNFNFWILASSQCCVISLRYLFKPCFGKTLSSIQARRHGVEPERIVIHEQFPTSYEFRVKALADLFLDTPLFNAHTTAGDILWCGVPLLTLPGENMAQRVAAGLVTGALTPETIARTLDDYEELAVRLAGARADVMRTLRERLKLGRGLEVRPAPVFDTHESTHDWERGLRMAWDVHAAIGVPSHLVVARRTD